MYTLDKIKKKIADDINHSLGTKQVKASDLVYPPDAKMGDLSLPCFSLANELGKNPAEIAGMIVGNISADKVVCSVKTVGPYVNFTLGKSELIKNVIKEIDKYKNEYGVSKTGKNERVMLEFSNGNTHKELHIGHLRNIIYGDSLTKILRANGFQPVPISYINDFGIHAAKTIWAYQEFYKNEPLPENKGYFLGKVYVRSSQELEKNQAGKATVNFIMKKIESREGEEYKLWQETRQWSIDQFAKVYTELNVHFEQIFYESDVIEKGRKIVQKLLIDGILRKSDGAVIADLEQFDLGVLVLLRSDGTSTYPVADLALAIEKFKKFKISKSIYIVDIRQSLYFKQLFKILEQLGYREEMIHLGYEFVKLPEGMMSSRTGNVITYEELREQVFAEAKKETKERHIDWSEEKISQTAWTLAISAIKFEMIKVGADQVITFDIDKALSFSGYTAAYIQYTYARIDSIIRKAGVAKLGINYELLSETKEKELIMKIAKYPEAVEQAGKNYNPAEIAKYIFELAQMVNDYYHQLPVLKAEGNLKNARLALISESNQVMSNGLALLGINVLREM